MLQCFWILKVLQYRIILSASKNTSASWYPTLYPLYYFLLSYQEKLILTLRLWMKIEWVYLSHFFERKYIQLLSIWNKVSTESVIYLAFMLLIYSLLIPKFHQASLMRNGYWTSAYIKKSFITITSLYVLIWLLICFEQILYPLYKTNLVLGFDIFKSDLKCLFLNRFFHVDTEFGNPHLLLSLTPISFC